MTTPEQVNVIGDFPVPADIKMASPIKISSRSPSPQRNTLPKSPIRQAPPSPPPQNAATPEQLQESHASLISHAEIPSGNLMDIDAPKLIKTDSNISEEPVFNHALFTEQLRWVLQMLRNLKRKKDCMIFLKPVDPVALNIPTYLQVVKQPMDIQTIEKKIATKAYTSIEEVTDDFDRMFSNCLLFNGEISAVSLMCKNVQMSYSKELVKMPRTAGSASDRKKKSTPADGFRAQRDSIGGRESMSGRGKPYGKIDIEQKFCSHIITELFKKQHSPYSQPFCFPVDAVALGIPHYFDVIKTPMDMTTIRKKLTDGAYEACTDFEADIRLMFNNCYTFNPPGTAVFNLGSQLEAVFNSKWNEKHSFMTQHGDMGRSRSKQFEVESSNDDEDDEEYQKIRNIKNQIALLNSQLAMLREKRSKTKKRKSMTTSGTAPNKKPRSQKSADKKERKKKRQSGYETEDQKEPLEITYEQKRELSDSINILPSDKLPYVFEIIKSNASFENSGDEEVELDIDSLDKSVLWKLYLFVRKHTQPEKATVTRTSALSQSSSEGSGSGSDSDSA